MRIFVHGAAATPSALLEAMVRRMDLDDVRLYHLHLEGPVSLSGADFRMSAHASSFRPSSASV